LFRVVFFLAEPNQQECPENSDFKVVDLFWLFLVGLGAFVEILTTLVGYAINLGFATWLLFAKKGEVGT
ncbi:hypothetical protein PanWU01x14_242940, partial [Parasponia andersonii]